MRGYYAALGVHGIVESVPHMTRHFSFWLNFTKGWSTCQGWAAAFERMHTDAEQALASFFAHVDQYRKLKLTGICTVRLDAEHNPTGKRYRIGVDGLMEKPLRVDVIRYRPEPLHFLRFHFRAGVVDEGLLMTRNGDYKTSLSTAKRWVCDELQVPFHAWQPIK